MRLCIKILSIIFGTESLSNTATLLLVVVVVIVVNTEMITIPVLQGF